MNKGFTYGRMGDFKSARKRVTDEVRLSYEGPVDSRGVKRNSETKVDGRRVNEEQIT